MSGVFLRIANMSISASYLILAVLALRLILRKVPKNLLIWLWALVAIRLTVPVSLESALSLIPKSQPIPADIMLAPAPAIHSGVPVIDRTVNPVIAENFTPTVTASVNPMQGILTVISIVWLLGVAAMLLYAAFSYLRLSKQVRVSMRLRGNLYLCDGIPTPFILGIVKPKIYLPSDMAPQNQSYVLRHERAHLRHHDNLWKPLGFLLLAVYWFHPLVWVAYFLFCRDLEMACDERAIMDLGDEEKKAYSYALLSCAAPRRSLAVCPVAFGENSVKSRIRNVLRFQKASIWVVCAVLLITVLAAVCFLTNPREEELPEEPTKETVTAPSTEEPTQETMAVPSAAQMAVPREEFEPLDGTYTYTNGDLMLEFHGVSAVHTRMVQGTDGTEFAQTTLLTEPGATVSAIHADMDNGKEAWRLCETTGTLAPILITDNMGRRNLCNDEFYLEDLHSHFRKVLLLRRGATLSVVNGELVPKTAKGALVYDRNTEEILYSYQRFQKIAPGDLSKLALALIVLEEHSPEEMVDTTALPGFLKGQNYRSFAGMPMGYSLEDTKEMSVEDLLTLMLMGDYDDAAYVLARFDGGSEAAMVEKMNEWVHSIACLDTHYTDLYGLAPGQYTTAFDTLILVNRMLENPCLASIWAKTQLTLHFPDSGEEYTVLTSNFLIDYQTIPDFCDIRVTGGFAYYHHTSGSENLVCTAKQNDLICVLLDAERKFKENGWQVTYFGSYEEMGAMLNSVLG